MASKLEINFTRLLGQCELLTSNVNEKTDWRLEKYVGALETLLTDLKRSPSSPANEFLTEYGHRVNFLKGLLQTEKLPTAIEKSMANQLIAPGPISTTEKLPKEIHLQTTSKYNKEMRKELLGDDEGLRHRGQQSPSSADLDSVLQYHQVNQDKIAEEILMLTHNMKQNSLLAGSIVKKDIETIDKSAKLANQNFDRLKVESQTLEVHTHRSCHWWIWMMLGAVCVTFITMVIFIKLFPKT